MGKLEEIKKQLAEIQNSEGEGFVVNKMNLAQELDKYEKENASLIIKVIIILGAFLGSSSLLSFLFVSGMIKSPLSMVVFGAVLIVAAVFLSNSSKILIFEVSIISLLIYGGFVLNIGLGELKISHSFICVVFLFTGLFIGLFSKNSTQLFIATLMFNSSLIILIHLFKMSWVLHLYHSLLVIGIVFIYLNEAKMLTQNAFLTRLYNPLKSGLLIVLLGSLFMISTTNFIQVDIKYIWASSIIPIAAILFLVQRILNQLAIKERIVNLVILLITAIMFGLTAIFPAISVSFLLILLCFMVNYKTGFVIGILSLVYFIVQLYFDLSFSLLIKSEMLLASGLVFGAFYFFSSKKLATHESN